MALIGWWKLDGDAQDSTGNGNHGNPSNITWEPGMIGRAARFNGVNGGISIPNASAIQRRVFTICAWIKSEGLGSGMQTAGIFSLSYSVTLVLNEEGRVSFRTNPSTHTATHPSLFDNKWHHVAAVQGDGFKEIYIDGDLVLSVDHVFNPVYFSPACIGYDVNNTNVRRFMGLIDDVRLYDHALSAKEIKDLSRAKILHYKFDDFQEPTENLWSGDLRIYNNYGVPATLTQLSETYQGQPIYRLGMTVTDDYADRLEHFRNHLHAHGVHGGRMTFKANTKYAASIYWRPVNKHDVVVGGTASNIGGWSSAPTESKGRWKRYTQVRNGSASSDATDSVFFSFRCPSLQLNETVYIDFACPQIEEKKDYSTEYTESSRGGVVHDSSGYGYDATLELNYTPTWTSDSIIGEGAYEFDDNKRIQSDESVLIEGSQSYSAWVFQKSRSGLQGIISTHNHSKTSNMTLSIAGGEPVLGFGYTDGTRDTYALRAPSISANQWHHVVGVYNAEENKAYLYVDGELRASKGLNKTVKFTEEKVLIGQWANSYLNNYEFIGIIDDARIYATALSEEDVRSLYRERASISDKGVMFITGLSEHHNWDEEIQGYNLIENGYLEYGNNYNHPDFEYDPVNHCLSKTSGSSSTQTSNFIKIIGNGRDSFDQYKLDGWIKGKDYESRYYYLIRCYDKNFDEIDVHHVNRRSNTETFLSQDLKPGDTWVYLDNIDNWFDDGTSNYDHQKMLGLWHPDDDPLYEPYRYTRRVLRVVEVDKPNKRLRLETPYNGILIPSGSPAQNHMSGSTYSYIAASNAWTNLNDWEYKSGTTSKTANVFNMRYGTSYVRVGFLINRNAVGGTPTTLVKNMRFYNITRPQKMESSYYINNIGSSGIVKSRDFSEVGIVDGMVAWYPLNNDSNDYSGNNNHATVEGPVLAPGIRGASYEFKVGDIIQANGAINTLYSSQQYSWGCWCYKTGTSHQNARLLMSSNNVLELTFNSSRRILATTRDASGHRSATSPETYPLNEWIHVFATCDGSTTTLYVNGVAKATTQSKGFNNCGNNLLIGNWSTLNQTFEGRIQDVRVYNRELSPEEVAILYKSTKPNPVAMQLTSSGIYVPGQFVEI